MKQFYYVSLRSLTVTSNLLIFLIYCQMLSKQKKNFFLSSKSKLPSSHASQSSQTVAKRIFTRLQRQMDCFQGPAIKQYLPRLVCWRDQSEATLSLIIGYVTNDALCNFTGLRF